jgi:pantoate--beta-alanine ligase
MASCLLGLGSNLGDRVGQLLAAFDALRQHPAIAVQRVSSLVETSAVGGPAGQGKYFNAAAVVETELPPADLLRELLAIEKQLGRERGECWGPRTIDLDLLLYGDLIIESPQLVLPHPRFHQRRFVLAPAAEIAPDWRHPALHKTIAEFLAALPAGEGGTIGMRVITQPAAIQQDVLALRQSGRRVGLVPTMGALHAGHLSLVRAARERADVVVATIFVNPAQFGPREDLAKYPRTLEADLQTLSAAKCDLVFVPPSADIYPLGFSTYVEPPAVSQPLEGVCRPGHFRGVATVVLKLFNLIPADMACFGQKDYQQLLVIRHMVRDLDLPIEIVPCPTVREADGLALSSRNRYLSPDQRQQALALSRALSRAEQLVASGERDGATILAQMRGVLNSAGIDRIDYVTLADPETLAEKPTIDGPVVAFIAAHVGTTRLIDNRLLDLHKPEAQARGV